jgi:uncharacterized protein YjbJ (UPF0337 family)
MCELCNSFPELCKAFESCYSHLCIENIFTTSNNDMNKTEAKGNWNEQKGKLKQKFAVLTDNDLMFEEGQQEEMLGKLQITLGKTKEELHKIFSSL